MKTAFVTGPNKGIGYEVARQLAAKGSHVFVGARNDKAGGKAASTLAKNGARATFVCLDISDSERAKRPRTNSPERPIALMSCGSWSATLSRRENHVTSDD